MTDQTIFIPLASRTDFRKQQVDLGGVPLEVYTLPGLPDWELVFPSAGLIAENVKINPTDHVLLLGCHQGALAAYLQRNLPAGQLSISDQNITAIEMTRLTLSVNKLPPAEMLTGVDQTAEVDQKFNAVIIQIPKGRLLSRRWLVQAYNALALSGNLYLVGSNRWGIESVIKDAQSLFGRGRILAYKKGNRLAHFSKRLHEVPEPDWAHAAGIEPHTWVEFSIPIEGLSYPIRSLPGIFSFDHLDAGTEMLLVTVQIPPGAKVLDAGCGYGIIGLFAAIKGAGMVHLIDNNLLALAACRETLSINNISNAQVFAGDLLNPLLPDKYDLILSNPPFHSGMAVDYQIAQSMIEASHQALNPGGHLVIVANRFIRYDRLIKEIYGNITILAESGKFHLLSGLKSSQEMSTAKKGG